MEVPSSLEPQHMVLSSSEPKAQSLQGDTLAMCLAHLMPELDSDLQLDTEQDSEPDSDTQLLPQSEENHMLNTFHMRRPMLNKSQLNQFNRPS